MARRTNRGLWKAPGWRRGGGPRAASATAGGGARTCATCERAGGFPRRGSGPRPLRAAGRGGHVAAHGDRGGTAGAQRSLERSGGAEAHGREAAGEAARAGPQRVRVRAGGLCGQRNGAYVRARGPRAGAGAGAQA